MLQVGLVVREGQADLVVQGVLMSHLSLGVLRDLEYLDSPHLQHLVDQVDRYLLLAPEDQEAQLVLLHHPFQGFL